MNQITDTLRDSKRIRLIATALELMQYEHTDSAVIPIPGTEPQRYVVVGSAATVARLLEIAPAASGPTTQREADERELMSRAIDAALDALGWAATMQDRRKALDLLSAARAAIDQSAPPASVGYVERAQLEWLARSTTDAACVSLWRTRVPIDSVPVYLVAGAATQQATPEAPAAPQAASTASASDGSIYEAVSRHANPEGYAEAMAQIDEVLARATLPAQAVDVARDAARYRFLRECALTAEHNDIEFFCRHVPTQEYSHESLNAAIDAAMSHTNTTGGSE